jgi:hypothetical protein
MEKKGKDGCHKDQVVGFYSVQILVVASFEFDHDAVENVG